MQWAWAWACGRLLSRSPLAKAQLDIGPGLTSVGRGDRLRESGTRFPVLEVLTPHS